MLSFVKYLTFIDFGVQRDFAKMLWALQVGVDLWRYDDNYESMNKTEWWGCSSNKYPSCLKGVSFEEHCPQKSYFIIGLPSAPKVLNLSIKLSKTLNC